MSGSTRRLLGKNDLVVEVWNLKSVGHDGIFARNGGNAPVQEPRPMMVTWEKIEEFTDKALEDFPNHLFIERERERELEVGHDRKIHRDRSG